MTDVIMTADQLMQAADRLTGVTPGMGAEEIRARQSVTPETLLMRYLIDSYKETRDSGERADIRERLVTLAAENPHLAPQIKQALPLLPSVTAEAKVTREQKLAQTRERVRRLRQRQRGTVEPDATPGGPS